MTEHLDARMLSELREIMEDKFDDLLTVFLRESASQYRTLNQAWAKGTRDSVHRIAHSLKGSCANMGARECALIASNLESAAYQNRWSEVPELLRQLDRELAATHAALEPWTRRH